MKIESNGQTHVFSNKDSSGPSPELTDADVHEPSWAWSIDGALMETQTAGAHLTHLLRVVEPFARSCSCLSHLAEKDSGFAKPSQNGILNTAAAASRRPRKIAELIIDPMSDIHYDRKSSGNCIPWRCMTGAVNPAILRCGCENGLRLQTSVKVVNPETYLLNPKLQTLN